MERERLHICRKQTNSKRERENGQRQDKLTLMAGLEDDVDRQ